MIPFRKTIGFRLLIISFCMLTLPLLIDAAVVFTKKYENSVDSSKSYLTESAVLRILPTTSLEPFPTIAFEILSDFLNLSENFPQEQDPKLNKIVTDLAELENLYDMSLIKVDANNRYIVVAAAREELIGKDVTTYFHNPTPFEVAKEYKDDPVAGYLSYTDTKHLYLVGAYGVFSKEEKPTGIIAIGAEATDWANEVLLEDNTYYPVRFAVLNPSTIVLAATDKKLLFNYFKHQSEEQIEAFNNHQFYGDQKLISDKPVQLLEPIQNSGFLRFNWDGHEQFGIIKPMPWWDYLFLAYASKKDIYARPLKDFISIFVTYSVILTIGGILTYLITKRWMVPVQTLGSVMLRAKGGDLQARYVQDRWGHNINELGAIFNQMVDDLLKNKAAAEKERLQRDLLSQELELGKQAQEKLLHEPDQDFGTFDVAQAYVPASEVGGDFYDIFRKANGKLVMSIADASGKGVLACCFSLAARNILRTLAASFDDVSEVLFRGNNLFCADTKETGMFVTVEMVQYDYESGLLSYSSLGHNPGIICRKDGTIERLTTTAMAMGVTVKDAKPEKGELKLYPQDIVVLFTDGITEMHNPQSELFGEKRLIDLIQKERAKTAKEIANSIQEAIRAFAASRPQFDDVTLIVGKING